MGDESMYKGPACPIKQGSLGFLLPRQRNKLRVFEEFEDCPNVETKKKYFYFYCGFCGGE